MDISHILDGAAVKTLSLVSVGSAIGTVWRMVMRPETNVRRFFVKVVVSLTVGGRGGRGGQGLIEITGW